MIDWGQWRQAPALVDALVFLGWAYAIFAGPIRPRLAPGVAWPRRAAVRFYSGLGLVYLAVGSPMARIGDVYLFSAHVGLQLLILFPAAMLVLTGLPGWMVDAALGRPAVRRAAAIVLRPWVCGAVFVLVISVWYTPKLFEWGLESAAGRGVEQAVFFASGLVFWWPLASPSRIRPPSSFASRMVYLFALEVALTAVFSYVLMAEHPIYPTYSLAPRLVPGLDAVNDQILGGILLSGVSSLVLVGVLGSTFFKWARAA